MAKEARHHHYIPQCYLRGFLPTGQKKPKLTVVDLKRKQVFLTSTRGVGGIRDFNRIVADGVAPDSLENDLSSFEAQAATAFRKLEEQRSLSDKDVFITIINLIALLAIRHPQVRTNVADAQTSLAKLIMAITVSSKERYESALRRAREGGADIDEDVSYEQAKESFERGEYDIVVPNEFHIAMEFKGIDTILPYLFGRGWVLYVAGEDAGPFVTSDRPVILEWNNAERIPPFYRHSPGFGLKNTRVIFPVSQNMALIGEYDTPDALIVAGRRFVSLVNTEVIRFARPQVYAPNASFRFVDAKGNVRPSTDLLRPSR